MRGRHYCSWQLQPMNFEESWKFTWIECLLIFQYGRNLYWISLGIHSLPVFNDLEEKDVLLKWIFRHFNQWHINMGWTESPKCSICAITNANTYMHLASNRDLRERCITTSLLSDVQYINDFTFLWIMISRDSTMNVSGEMNSPPRCCMIHIRRH